MGYGAGVALAMHGSRTMLVVWVETGVRVASIIIRWGTFLPNLGTVTLGLWVLALFATYATDRQTDRRTDGQKQRVLPLLYTGGA